MPEQEQNFFDMTMDEMEEALTLRQILRENPAAAALVAAEEVRQRETVLPWLEEWDEPAQAPAPTPKPKRRARKVKARLKREKKAKAARKPSKPIVKGKRKGKRRVFGARGKRKRKRMRICQLWISTGDCA